MVLNTTRIFSL